MRIFIRMLSTPIRYADNPRAMLDTILSLEPEETQLFARGYVQACDHMLEGLSSDKADFLNVMLVSDERTKHLLGQFLYMLDGYTEKLEERVKLITQLFASRDPR